MGAAESKLDEAERREKLCLDSKNGRGRMEGAFVAVPALLCLDSKNGRGRINTL